MNTFLLLPSKTMIIFAAGLLLYCSLALTVDAFIPARIGTGILGTRRIHTESTGSCSRKHKRLSMYEEHFDMDELRQRIRDETNPYSDLLGTAMGTAQPAPEKVHILVFNPNTDQQGIHTIEYPQGSGNNFILAFESKIACDKFAATLKAQQFFDPTPQVFELGSLESFCEKLGVFVQVIPKGVEILPPTQNVKTLGHNPSLKDQKKNLDYIFAMGDSEMEEDGLQLFDTPLGSWG